jgi:hypothetical protein
VVNHPGERLVPGKGPLSCSSGSPASTASPRSGCTRLSIW